MAKSIFEFFNNQKNINFINGCLEGGLNFKKGSNIGNKLAGYTFVITGTINGLSRSEIKSKLELDGAKVSSSISSKTTYLVSGNKPGSKKIVKANQLGIEIIDEKKLFDLINVIWATKLSVY